ncbi:MAG: GDP-perosamine synthase [Myxococcota bacterium]|nr:GDP-perosamine synthase [Myxococcota bacterium]
MTSPMIPIARVTLLGGEDEAAALVVRSGWLAQGKEVEQFEAAAARIAGRSHAAACSSATTALHLAALLAGVGPGDEVIFPSYTFAATANAIIYCGATPVPAGADPLTWNLDVEDAIRRVSSRTKAIIAVHQIGLPMALTKLEDFCRRRNIRLIEDAACAIGGMVDGRPAGSFGDISVFSFHPRKIMTAGEGGMVLVNDPGLAALARSLRNQGIEGGVHRRLGYNYRMTDLNAAIGNVQLRGLPTLLKGRREAGERYQQAFAGIPGICLQPDPPEGRHTWQSYGFSLDGPLRHRRAEFLARLGEQGITAKPGVPPVHLEPYFRERWQASLPITEDLDRRAVLIPIWSSMSAEEIARVIGAVTNAARGLSS